MMGLKKMEVRYYLMMTSYGTPTHALATTAPVLISPKIRIRIRVRVRVVIRFGIAYAPGLTLRIFND